MKGIISIFENLINIIKTIFSIVTNFFKSIGVLLQIVTSVIANIVSLTADLPPYITAFVMATIAVSVLFIVLGRQGGKSS